MKMDKLPGKITFGFFWMCSLPLVVFSQKAEKEPQYNYFSFGSNVYTNAVGTFKEKTFLTFEFGRSFGIFDILAVSKEMTVLYFVVVKFVVVQHKITAIILHDTQIRRNIIKEKTNAPPSKYF